MGYGIEFIGCQVWKPFLDSGGSSMKVFANTTMKVWKAQHKKWNFPLKISSVNVTKSAVFYGSGHIY